MKRGSDRAASPEKAGAAQIKDLLRGRTTGSAGVECSVPRRRHKGRSLIFRTIATESGLLPSPAYFPLFMRPFLKFTALNRCMAKNDNQVSMPSSQGGLVQYMDADTGIEVDPKVVIAFGFMVAFLTMGLHL